MPATEKTWRDQAWMHVIFGVSSLVMLGGTIWMLAKDHNREWRQWQLNDRARERWTAEAQLAQAKADSTAKLDDLRSQLVAEQSSQVDTELVGRFRQLVETEDARLAETENRQAPADFSKLGQSLAQLESAENGSGAAAEARKDLLAELEGFVREARRRESTQLNQRKFLAADQTAAVSARGLAVGEGRPTAKIEAQIQKLADRIQVVDAAYAEAKDYRVALETVQKEIQAEELELIKQREAIETELARLEEGLPGTLKNTGEWVNRLPVLDALYTGDIKLDQIWLPDMKINYNFSYVARYDRCIVCHRVIDKTAPGSATEPAYPAIPRGERERMVQLSTPDESPFTAATPATGEGTEPGEPPPTPSIESVYGMVLAPNGQVDKNAVTIQVVMPESRAAVAGLQTGDILQEVNGGEIVTKADVTHYLLDEAQWGQPLTLKIRRGLDQPFTSHPRLDLFVGANSPHKKGEMGCTICHDGQGSGTEFKWVSHTPNDPQRAVDWSRKYGWFDNHHWIFPMTPERFIESNCLKCHHEVVDLEPSERFPDPPAPKLVQGYHLVREFGCYGCHEINGFDGPTKRIGPDLRTEPNYYDVAAQILTDPGLNDVEKQLARTVVHQPDDAAARSELYQVLRADAALASATPAPGRDENAARDQAERQQPRLTAATHALADALRDVDAPGRMRKVGPSLRHLDSKVDYDWLYGWIRRPTDFRPSTRMPQFFLHFEHLNGEREEFPTHDTAGNETNLNDREYTARFENIEIRALADFLLRNSQPFTYLDPPQGVTETASAERGRWLFESRGCLACHSHAEFPGIASNQGPDLSRVAAKFNTGKGQRWLYSWLRDPRNYHARTAMPNLFLDPITEVDASGNPIGRVSDPAADIVAFLLGVPVDWQPEVAAPARELSADEEAALADLTSVWLSASFPRKRAARYAREGIPERLAATVKVDEQVLIGMTPANRAERQLEYVARRSLSRYGCFGCHDIPGFEAAKPIGTPLSNWGRKDTSQLAFENIGTFLATHGIDGTGGQHEANGASEAHQSSGEASHGGHAEIDPLDDKYDSDTSYFLQSLNSHQRNGFLWQKLRMPRSYDYETTRTKRYDERLRMPKFNFTDAEREAVMTFILGLTSEAPDARYIYKPSPRQQAIVQGRHVLDKYNCAGCHILEMERWRVAFEPDWFQEPPPTNDYPFVIPSITPEQIQASLTPDRRGLLHADLYGMPTRDETTGAPRVVDEDGVPIEPDDTESQPFYEFQLYDHAVVAGAQRMVGVQNLMIPANRKGGGPARGTAHPGFGGDLAKYLYPRVIADEKKTNPAAVASEAWGWLPPPLHHEGDKVQTDWLHDFLMDPTAIRPAVVMRMPNFHMSSDEASRLVNYFAAMSNAEFPYEYNNRRRGGYLAQLEASHPTLLGDGMKILTDGNYCVKCHSIGDYQVRGAVKTLGPDLDEVYRRMRPEFVHHWVANPQRTLPYTGMPVNIPFDPNSPTYGGVSQELFRGSSFDQLSGLVDLLMNFDEYTRRQTSVKGLVREPTAPAGGQPSAAQSPPENRSASR
jgi:cytochrome c2